MLRDGPVLVIAAVIALSLALQAPPAQAQVDEPPPSASTTFSIDGSAAAIGNHHRQRTDLTIGGRASTPLWYSPLAWRFQIGVRTSLQVNVSPRLTVHPYLGLDGGMRFVFLPFFSVEGYVGPRLAAQFGREGNALTTGVGATVAYLFHPGPDNRQRFRLGMELQRFSPVIPFARQRPLNYRHLGFFLGYEMAL